MAKLYIHKATNGDSRFRSDAANARSWPSSVAAEGYCISYEHFYPLTLNPLPGVPRIVCSGFKVEERTPDQFVIFFEVPDADLAGAIRSSEPW